MINLNLTAYKNGEYKALGEIGPSILDFGFIHCDATYDVMPIYNGKAFCYERHLERFKNSAERYGLQIPDVDCLEIIKTLYKGMQYSTISNSMQGKYNKIDNAFVWFIVWRGYPESGNPRDIDNCPINFAMYIKPSYPIADSPIVSVFLDTNTKRVNDDYYGQEFKNMAWLDLTMSQRNKPDGYDTTVLVDIDGNVTEGPGFNIGIVKNDCIHTADKNVLKGITMSVVEDIAAKLSIPFERRPITQMAYATADEVFIASSSGGITATKKSGLITELLIKEYELKKEEYATNLGPNG
jgi:branched-chain amino acid aminotransferase